MAMAISVEKFKQLHLMDETTLASTPTSIKLYDRQMKTVSYDTDIRLSIVSQLLTMQTSVYLIQSMLCHTVLQYFD